VRTTARPKLEGRARVRIAIGGIRHETNTFSPLRTGMPEFTVRRGREMLSDLPWAEGLDPDIELVPTLSAEAMPHGLVRRETYQTLKGELIERLGQAGDLDGIYLDLHGAMEVEEIGDGESDLIGAVRALAGPEVQIAASLDLHANLAPAVVEGVNVLTAYRTAPHRDQTATRRRAVTHLIDCLRQGIKPVTAMVKPPLLLPGEFAVTDVEPARSLYRLLDSIYAIPGILDASLLIGCAWTDSPFTSTSAIVVAESDRALALAQAARLAGAVWDQRANFAPETPMLSVDEAIAAALSLPERAIFLSDSGDNVTAGGAGDSPMVAAKLLAARVPDVVVAGLADAPAVAACARAGLGGQVSTTVGGKLDPRNSSPLPVDGVVVYLYPPEQPTLAVLRVGGLDIVLTADRRSFTTRADLARAGIDAGTRKLIVVKLGYLFPELRELASHSFLLLSPGCTDLRLTALPYERVRRPIFPLDAEVGWYP
jgi:microcystin degradation protein MlrC